MAGELLPVQNYGTMEKFNVAPYAGGKLQINIDQILPTPYHPTRGTIVWAGKPTLMALFLDINDIPVTGLSDNTLSKVDFFKAVNRNDPSVQDAWNSVCIVPEIYTADGPINNLSIEIPVPPDARKMVWAYVMNIKKRNGGVDVIQNLNSLDKFLVRPYDASYELDNYMFLDEGIIAKKDYVDIDGNILIQSNNVIASDSYPLTSNNLYNYFYGGKHSEYSIFNYTLENNSVFSPYSQSAYENENYTYHRFILRNINILGEAYVNTPPIVEIVDGENLSTINSENSLFVFSNVIDNDGDQLSYQWSIVNDDGTKGTLLNNTTPTVQYTAPKIKWNDGVQTITLQLSVSDLINPPVTKTATITINPAENNPPETIKYEETLQVDGGTTVTLNDFNVYDPDDDILTYEWRQDFNYNNMEPQVNLNIAEGENADIVTDDGLQISLPVLQYGTSINTARVVCKITDEGGLFIEKAFNIIINTEANSPPIVDAGPDQEVLGKDIPLNGDLLISLDGSYEDVNEIDTITYYWEQISGPNIILSNNQILNPTFVPIKPTSRSGDILYTFRLTVLDGVNDPVTDTVNINLKAPENQRPIVPDEFKEITVEVESGVPLTFVESNAYDPEGDVLTYTWRQTSGPSLLDPDTNQPINFNNNPDFFGDTNTLQLLFPSISQNVSDNNVIILEGSVSDGLLTAVNKVKYIFNIIRDANVPPVANAGTSFTRQYVDGLTIDLDGSKSYDDDNGPSLLSYSWQLLEPQLIGFTINNSNSSKPSFTVPSMTSSDDTLIMVFRLTVSDGLDTDTSDITVTIVPPEPEIIDGNIYYDEITQEVVVDGVPNPVTMENIYDALSTIDPSQMWCQRLGDKFYMITSQGGVRIKNNSRVEDKSISLVVTGNKFIIEKGSHLKLGTYDGDATADGCFLSIPEIEKSPYYSFGNYLNAAGDSTESGNLYLYASKIDIWNFWGFFSGPDQEVHIIDCVVNGYGRVEGTNTILRNVTFQQSHTRFGIISVKGEIQQYESLISQKADGASFYYNPIFVGQEMLVKNSEFKNYTNLVYSENNPDANLKVCRFLDCKFNGNYNVSPLGDNLEVVISYTFEPIITNYNFEVYQNVDIEISDQYGQVVFTGQTNEFGKIETILDVRMKPDYESLVFNIRLTKEGEFVDYRYEHDETPWINKPLYIRDPILEPLNQPTEPVDPGNPNPGLDIVISPDATSVVYVSAYTTKEMEEMKEYVLSKIPTEELSSINIYTDRARHAYDKRPSYDELLMRALAGDIKRIYTYEEETFGPTRKDITIDLLVLSGIDVVYTAT